MSQDKVNSEFGPAPAALVPFPYEFVSWEDPGLRIKRPHTFLLLSRPCAREPGCQGRERRFALYVASKQLRSWFVTFACAEILAGPFCWLFEIRVQKSEFRGGLPTHPGYQNTSCDIPSPGASRQQKPHRAAKGTAHGPATRCRALSGLPRVRVHGSESGPRVLARGCLEPLHADV